MMRALLLSATARLSGASECGLRTDLFADRTRPASAQVVSVHVHGTVHSFAFTGSCDLLFC